MIKDGARSGFHTKCRKRCTIKTHSFQLLAPPEACFCIDQSTCAAEHTTGAQGAHATLKPLQPSHRQTPAQIGKTIKIQPRTPDPARKYQFVQYQNNSSAERSNTQTLLTGGVFGQSEVKSVMEGDSVTLNSDLTEIMDGGLIQWVFGNENTLIAEINRQTSTITVYDDVLDGRFKDRLKLDKQTGSLTITNVRIGQAGRYKLQTNSPKGILIAEINNQTDNITVYGRFSDKLDKQTGSLTITNTRPEHAGLYKLHINSVTKIFRLTVYKNIDPGLYTTPFLQKQLSSSAYSCHQQKLYAMFFKIKLCELSALVGVATVLLLVYDIRCRRAEQDQAHIHTSET
ncbi:T-lymphocyte surface antigen Ly-9 [Labeo rohita]|uniref:T-lymphocyte surface antigen Ly-9 n=1 Tax=Labeo rohita TaxID=84645 RepID=A0ABQ8L605_LABRO|nr:T-lymphocyte surface antigen Ly-9 [Labeo rohita]